MISIIVAIDNNNAIGRDNQMPWHLSDDLKRFKSITMGRTVIMGKNTWLSLPFKPLQGRRNIVISRTMPETEGCEVVKSIDDAIAAINKDEQAYIMGGARVYEQTIDLADELIVTHIDFSFDHVDAFFPAIDPKKWIIHDQSEIQHDAISNLYYKYITYRRTF